jgi:hypothetical protein
MAEFQLSIDDPVRKKRAHILLQIDVITIEDTRFKFWFGAKSGLFNKDAKRAEPMRTQLI